MPEMRESVLAIGKTTTINVFICLINLLEPMFAQDNLKYICNNVSIFSFSDKDKNANTIVVSKVSHS